MYIYGIKTTYMRCFLISIVIIPFILFGQINHFDRNDARWNVVKSYPHANIENPSFIESKTTVYGIFGDTIIDGKEWKKIGSSPMENFVENLVLEAFLYSYENYIFYRSNSGEIDTLYNFNLEVGDSLRYDINETTTWIKVIEIDELNINDTPYKRIIFSEPYGDDIPISLGDYLNEQWIEGIGSIHGPLFPIAPFYMDTEGSEYTYLSCSFANDSLHFHSPNYEKCYVNNILSTIDETANDFFFYPNPFDEYIYVTTNFKPHFPLEITDISGKIIYSKRTVTNSKFIDLSRLKRGIYFIGFGHSPKKKMIKM